MHRVHRIHNAAFASACSADAGPAACSSDAGATDADSSDAPTDGDAEGGSDASADADAATDAGITPSVDGCASCVGTTCNEPRKACAAGTACASFLGCINACEDTACADDCSQRFAEGAAKAMELSNCTLTGCRGACAL